jgi:hypothetical protein
VFGGFVFVVVFLPHFLHSPCVRCGLLLMPVFGVLFWSGFSDFNAALPCVVGGFCLESLILAQDERWRRA